MQVVSARAKQGQVVTGLQAKAKENPLDFGGMASGWLGKTLILGGSAAGTFAVVDSVTTSRIEAVVKDNVGKSDVEITAAVVKELQTEALVKGLGAVVIGFIGARFIRSPLGQFVTWGISAGLFCSAVNDWLHSDALVKGNKATHTYQMPLGA